MTPKDHKLWSEIVSPGLRELVIGVTTGVSPKFTEKLPLHECGDFFWAIVCISRAAPEKLLERYRTNVSVVDENQMNRLLQAILTEPVFYGFQEGELTALMTRLNANVRNADGEEQQRAHYAAFKRIEHILLFLAQEHPNVIEWLKPVMQAQPLNSQNNKPKRKNRHPHLRLV